MAIRSNVNLQRLKKSGLPKHKKIYDKAMKMIWSDYVTPKLSESEIMGIAERYQPLKVSVTINGDITVCSKCDRWAIIDEGAFYTLYHESMSIKAGKFVQEYHIQDVFYDLDFLFASIISHDEYKMSNSASTMDDIESLVKLNNALAQQGSEVYNFQS